MAVRLVNTIQRWRGSSKDEKPSGEVPQGSTFREDDTDTLWVYTPPAGWIIAEREVAPLVQTSNERLGEIIGLLRDIKTGHEEHLWETDSG